MRIIVNIDVPTLGPAVAFYRDALGLTLSRVIDGDVAELTDASFTFYLLEKPPGLPPTPSGSLERRYTRHWTPVHIDFVVDDLEAATRRALAAGATQESECVSWRGSECITFSDPFGHGFCLIEFENNGYTEETPDETPR